MKDKRTILRIIVLGVIVIALGSAFYTAYSNDKSIAAVGNVAPDFTLTNLEGKQVSLSDMRGKGVFINFWATWCGPCKREMPLMEKQYQEMKDQGIEILAVNIAESNVAVSSFIDRLGVTFPVLLDSNPDRIVTQRYGVGALPASFFVDKDGNIAGHYVGEMNESILKEHLELIKP
jgi:peroxiredoxin